MQGRPYNSASMDILARLKQGLSADGEEPRPSEPEKAPFQFVAAGIVSGISAPGLEIVRGQDCWDRLWARHMLGLPFWRSTPRVNFQKHIVLGAWIGEQMACGASVQFAKLEYRGGDAIVHVKAHLKRKNVELCNSRQRPRPFALVKIAKVSGEVFLEPDFILF